MIKYKNVRIIEVNDFDNLVEETYKRPYSFQQQDGCKGRGIVNISVPEEEDDYENTSIPEMVNGEKMGVSFQTWLDRDPKQRLNTKDEWDREHGLNLFWERNFYPHVSMIINDLYKRGLIEAGDYKIDIDW